MRKKPGKKKMNQRKILSGGRGNSNPAKLVPKKGEKSQYGSQNPLTRK
jgi:hypothetical protein